MTQSGSVFVTCPCSICEGESVKQSVAIKHTRDAELEVARTLGTIANAKPAESEGDGAVDGLVNEVFRWTLGGRTSNVQWKQGDAIWEQDSELLDESSSPSARAHPAPMPLAASRSKGTPAIPSTREQHEKTLYDESVLLGNKLGSRINLWLSIIPGPREPETDQTNHFLRPLVGDPLKSWVDGIWYTKTKSAGGSAGFLSPFYSTQRLKDVNNILDHVSDSAEGPRRYTNGNSFFLSKTWTHRNKEQWVKDAKAFRDASSKAERARIFQATGVRWSVLLDLPYWDPTKHVVVDAMHNLFLNLVKHHCCEILQIDLVGDVKDEESVPVATPEEMVAARKMWANGAKSKNQLRNIKVPALLALCIENQVVLPRPNGGQLLLRSQIIDAPLSVSLTLFVTYSC